ncbi:MAG TPA: MoaD/ThiS family protein [Sphingomicrobium sp.]|jgi:molybdopterin converting factor small subunit|nr:MoaD/ThiS family protein [Sphingomicrobium sp.]
MRILFYGRLADVFGMELDLDAETGSSIADVRQRLAIEHPGSAADFMGKRVVACVGGSVVRDDYVIGDNDAIEFLPPVSGG